MKLRVLAVIAATLFAAGAHAATISQFGRTTNDGVWTLSASQAAALGVPQATKIAAFRVRAHGPGNVTWNAGDTFDATAIGNSIISGRANVFGFFNGENDLLDYTGGFLDTLGVTRFLTSSKEDGSLTAGVFIAFRDSFVVRGTSTFGAATRGDFPHPVAPVPVPGALPLLLAGLGGLALAARRRRAAA
jgi:hypothetical protein